MCYLQGKLCYFVPTLDVDIPLPIGLSRDGSIKREKVRCIYENEHILVTHFFGTFPNGSQDAIMWVGLKKDGLIFRVETGSTPINLS